jgi:hypothetical protein
MRRQEFLTSGSAACVALACGHAFAATAPTQAKIATVELNVQLVPARIESQGPLEA